MTKDGINAQELERFMKPFVAMVVREISPKSDDISASQAGKIYGRYWIEMMTLRGDLSPRFVNSRKVYSRAQIEALRSVESTPAAITVKRKGYGGRPKGSKNKPKTDKATAMPLQITETSDNIPL